MTPPPCPYCCDGEMLRQAFNEAAEDTAGWMKNPAEAWKRLYFAVVNSRVPGPDVRDRLYFEGLWEENQRLHNEVGRLKEQLGLTHAGKRLPISESD
jgi:hypothetical protein